MKVASFFSGIGGIDLGLEEQEWKLLFNVKFSLLDNVFLKSIGKDTILTGDITKVSGADIPDVDVFAGGFPCQDLSLANQGKRKGLEGARSGLFYKYAELIGEKHPRWVFIENVPGLLNSAKGGDFNVVLSTLDELGYGVSWRVLDAKFFGTPQRRRRTYIIGSLGTLGSAEVLFEQGTNPVTNQQSNRPRNFLASSMMEAYQKQLSFLSSMQALADEQVQAPKEKDIETMERLILSTPEAARMLYVRRMLPSEYERLQGFPVGWTEIDSEQ